MRLFHTGTIVTLLSLAFCASSLAQSSTFSKLVVFGDSISDTGNLAFIDLPPPYFENRISNGPVAVDFIAASIGSNADASRHLFGQASGFNYAVSGGNAVGSDPEDLSQQVSAFLMRSDQQADNDALYVIIIGGNDLRSIRSITDSATASASIGVIVAQVESQINRLIDAGARAFLVANVANIGRIPETQALNLGQPSIAFRAEQYVREYNLALSPVLANFSQRSDVSLVEFDLFQALENVLDNASNFGFTNIEEGCFDPGDFSVETECLIFGFDSRVFFDNIHPSAATNRLIAPLIVGAIPQLPEPTPEPEVDPPAVIISPILDLLLKQN